MDRGIKVIVDENTSEKRVLYFTRDRVESEVEGECYRVLSRPINNGVEETKRLLQMRNVRGNAANGLQFDCTEHTLEHILAGKRRKLREERRKSGRSYQPTYATPRQNNAGQFQRRVEMRTPQVVGEKLDEMTLFSRFLAHVNQNLLTRLRQRRILPRQLKLVTDKVDKRFCGVVSAMDCRETVAKGSIGLVWQAMDGATPKFISVSISYKRTIAATGRLSIYCTCDALHDGSADFSCDHVRLIRENSGLMSKLNEILGDVPLHISYFGQAIIPESENFLQVRLSGEDKKGSADFWNLRDQGQKWVDAWNCWVVFDVWRNEFVSVLKKKGQMFKCQLCCVSVTKRVRCAHEIVCGRKFVEEDKGSKTDRVNVSEAEELRQMFIDHQRPLLPCPSEIREQERLTRLVRALEGGSSLHLEDSGTICRNWIFQGARFAPCPGKLSTVSKVSRSTVLHTLIDGTVKATVYDRKCERCGFLNRYSGREHAIFSGAKESLYATDLMYNITASVFLNANSLRSNVSGLSRLRASPSVRMVGCNQNDGDIFSLATRRRISDAFSLFMTTLTNEDEELTQMFFSCPECEVPLTRRDRMELGLSLDPAQHTNLKRFKGVVIDGTSAGIRNELPHYERKPIFMPHPGSYKPLHVVRKEATCNAVKEVIGLCCAMLRKASSPSFTHSTISTRPAKVLSGENMIMLKLLMDDSFCFCEKRDGQHTINCRKKVESFGVRDPKEIGEVLRTILVLEESGRRDDEVILKRRKRVNTDEDAYAEHESERERNEPVTGPLLRFRSSNIVGQSQLLDATLSLVNFLAVEPAAIPYSLPPTDIYLHSPEDLPIPPHSSLFEEEGVMVTSYYTLAKPSLKFHLVLADSMQDYAEEHREHDAAQLLSLRKLTRCIVEINVLLYRFCSDVINASPENRDLAKRLCIPVSEIIRLHVEVAENIFKDQDRRATEVSVKYSKAHRSVFPRDVRGRREDCLSCGICFPERSRCRPFVTFNENETGSCNKTYYSSSKFTPGLLTIQCVCKEPICVGFIVLTRPESISIALASILAHFCIPPRAIYYDNACNLFNSAAVRVPWVLRMTRFNVDRFHHVNHKCSSVFDTNCYRSATFQRTSTAESINSKIKQGISVQRQISGSRLVNFVMNKVAILNIAAHFRKSYGAYEMEDEDIRKYFREKYSCRCLPCTRGSNGDEAQLDGQ